MPYIWNRTLPELATCTCSRTDSKIKNGSKHLSQCPEYNTSIVLVFLGLTSRPTPSFLPCTCGRMQQVMESWAGTCKWGYVSILGSLHVCPVFLKGALKKNYLLSYAVVFKLRGRLSWTQKITCQCFDWMVHSFSRQKWRSMNKHCYL